MRRPLHLPILDGLRGFAVLLVLLDHSHSRFFWKPIESWTNNHIEFGALGVQIFFCLSGFLVTRILWSAENSPVAIPRFLLRRFFRIFPIYYVTLFVTAIFVPGAYIGWCFFYLSNYYFSYDLNLWNPLRHTWSLAVEEHFYLFWPFLFYCFPTKNGKVLLILSLIALSVFLSGTILLLFEINQARELLIRTTQTQIFSILIGALLAVFEQEINLRRAELAKKLLGMIFVGIFLFIFTTNGMETPFEIAIAFLKTNLFACCLVLYSITVCANSFWEKLFSIDILRKVGKISYGLYLYHYPIFVLFRVRKHLEPSGFLLEYQKLNVLLAYGVTFLLAILSYRYLERPLLQWSERLSAEDYLKKVIYT